ncbi:MAG: hypothetical protein JNM63_09050 [Spirochaetia bacterium]|nr:hypothetical protein [Spirochaetia bacterium]
MKILIHSALAAALLISCKSVEKSVPQSKAQASASTGWVGEDTYVVYVETQWDRSRFYPEGQTARPGCEARSSEALKALARENAVRAARKLFLKSIQSDSRLPDLKDAPFMTPIAVTENYTPEGDAKILFKFQTKGLRSLLKAGSGR